MALRCRDDHIVDIVYVATLANRVHMMYLKFFSSPYLFVTRRIWRVAFFHYRLISGAKLFD